MKRLDYILIAFIMVVSILGLIFVKVTNKEGTSCKVYLNGQVYGSYLLDKTQNVDIIVGDRITNTIQIEDGSVKMIYADCPDKVCINQGEIDGSIETICCAPNNIIVVIDDTTKEVEYDAITK